MVCHWPGIYFNGEKTGFNILKEIKKRLDQKYDNLKWMKLSEIARYWAAKELTSISADRKSILIKAPFSTRGFTIKLNSSSRNMGIKRGGEEKPLERIKDEKSLKSGTYYSARNGTIICFDLEKGLSEVVMS
jgi:hypothetical protein